MIVEEDILLCLAHSDEMSRYRTFVNKIYSLNLKLIDLFDSFKSLQLTTKEELELAKKIKEQINIADIENLKSKLSKHLTGFLPLNSVDYPWRLKNIHDSPLGLFYKGDLNILKEKRFISIVGTRNPTSYGLTLTKKIVNLFIKERVVIISGLASGIDSIAHKSTLEEGKTIAVLGTGVDKIFPVENFQLFNDIVLTGGLILSEYPPATQGFAWNFPQRNRIISALSDAVIVIEGDVQSGAIITARFAIKHDKPLFALPGPIDSQMSNGPNLLIKSGAAEMLTSIDDIWEKIGGNKQIKLNLTDDNMAVSKLSEEEKSFYKVFSHEPKSIDALLIDSGLELKKLLNTLSILELKGVIQKNEIGYCKS